MKILATFAVFAFLVHAAAAAPVTFTTIYSFSGADGQSPVSKLLTDSAGNLYGTTQRGGANGWGSVFELSPNGDGTWTESTLYSFCASFNGFSCDDGSEPVAGLILDSQGNLFGTTSTGSNFYCGINSEGCGTVFELSPPSPPSEPWTYSVLYYFCQNNVSKCPDGADPQSKLVFDASGNLYGTTREGGVNNQGSVFELSVGQTGWNESVLYSFCLAGPPCIDGHLPEAGVALDKQGNLYGTTSGGGGNKLPGGGVIYKLTHAGGTWTEQTIFAFTNNNKGATLLGEVNFDSAANLYSTAESGGANAAGVVFKLSSKGLQTISFEPNVTGASPTAGVLINPRNGDLYGTTSGGGQFLGSVYRVSRGKMTVLSGFNVGDQPMGALMTDGHHLYGTTKSGGDFGMGSVFEITP